MSVALRPYQTANLDALREAFRRVRCVVDVLPTGAGKTVIAAEAIQRTVMAGRRVLFLAHRRELIDQASAKLASLGVAHARIQAGEPGNLAQPVQVASVQTLARRLERIRAGDPGAAALGIEQRTDFDLVVVDECHHVAADSYRRILAAWIRARVLGLTATPYRLDGTGLSDVFEEMVVGATVPQLIEGGFLVPTQTFAPKPPEALAKIGTRAGEYRIDMASDILDKVGPTREIVAAWRAHAADRLTAVFACTVEHAEHLAAAFRDAGIAAASIEGGTEEKVRARTLADLRSGALRVIVNVGILTEGWDLPAIKAIVLARPTQSRALWRQMVGRGMRPCPGAAPDCLILDHASNCVRFGSPDAADEYSLQGSRGAAEDAGMVVCDRCDFVNEPRAKTCANCGEVLARETEVEERGPRVLSMRQEMSLEQFDEASELRLFALYADLVWQALDRSRNLGWAYHRLVETNGRGPQPWFLQALGMYQQRWDRAPHPRMVEQAMRKSSAFARAHPVEAERIATRFSSSPFAESLCLTV